MQIRAVTPFAISIHYLVQTNASQINFNHISTNDNERFAFNMCVCVHLKHEWLLKHTLACPVYAKLAFGACK